MGIGADAGVNVLGLGVFAINEVVAGW